jgi:hypothetical protein
MELQNNYTTPEQSRKLLELGIPDWTADCYFYEEGSIADDCTPQVVPFGEPYEDSSTETMFSSYISLPCWSLGRLIEIFNLINNKQERFLFWMNMSRYKIKNYVGVFIMAFEEMKIQNALDLSKLNDNGSES